MNNYFKVLLLSFLLTGFVAFNCFAGDKPGNLTERDQTYLKGIYQDTFYCLDYYTDPGSGFPYDVSDDHPQTSICNIGLYMASVAVAGKTGLIDETQAVEKLKKTLVSLEKVEKWHGFPITWVNVKTGGREWGNKFSYADHVAGLICGLLVVSGLYPVEFSRRVDDFIKVMDFGLTYDPALKKVKGGYDLSKGDFDINQSWGSWYYNILASDQRYYFLLGMALGKIPLDCWSNLNRNIEKGNPLDVEMMKLLTVAEKKTVGDYYWPGMEGGGIFMQYLPGIFLDEKNLPIGTSAKSMAFRQIKLAKANKYYPVWGISASETPDGNGYLGWGSLKKTVVTPHASVLAIADFTRDTLNNLRALEKKGVRPKVVINGTNYNFGFTDSYDVEKNQISRHYLSLDQGMLFLSLANFLHDDIVRKAFAATKLGKNAVDLETELEKDKKGELDL